MFTISHLRSSLYKQNPVLILILNKQHEVYFNDKANR